MSQSQVDATSVLCRLLEQRRPEIGVLKLRQEYGDAGQQLLHERLLGVGSPLSWVNCPECGGTQARYVRDVGSDRVLLSCSDCEQVDAPREILQVCKVNMQRVVDRLADGLGLAPTARKVVDADRLWRLGTAEPTRGRALTWYFGRQLCDPPVAARLATHIRADQATRSARIITSTDLPLPEGSALTGYSVVNLSTVARLSESKFTFFGDRVDAAPAAIAPESAPGTSLIRVRDQSVAFVDGKRYPLEPMQAKILLALVDDHDHKMEPSALRDACGSSADPFKPIKYFGRIPEVYKAFIHYLYGDKEYELVIADEDRDWLL